MHHTAKHHVIESIDPQWGDQNQYELRLVQALRSLLLNRQDAKYERGGLPRPSHNDDPTESFTVVEGLYDMAKGGKTEENSENSSCRRGRAIWPLIVRIISG